LAQQGFVQSGLDALIAFLQPVWILQAELFEQHCFLVTQAAAN
jgi:hypothetical protein